MEDNILGKTTLESMPKEFRGEGKGKNNFWLIILIVIVLLISGTYWFYAKKKSQVVNPATINQTQESSIDDLQAAAVNIAIPSFSQDF